MDGGYFVVLFNFYYCEVVEFYMGMFGVMCECLFELMNILLNVMVVEDVRVMIVYGDK